MPTSAFNRPTFLGLSVVNINSSIGLNGEVSQLQLTLIQDPANGDLLINPIPYGLPVYFQYYGFTFNGILKKITQTNTVQAGNPIYKVIITDLRELLAGVQVIIGGYSGPTSTVPNLLNAYGFWEATGFGNSKINQGGMPWYLILDAVELLTLQIGYTSFGGPLLFAGQAYAIDLSSLPVPPNDYRIGGNNASLMDLIEQICIDGGCDYFLTLNGFVIKVNVLSRYAQPPLGVLPAIVASNRGNSLVDCDVGVEVNLRTNTSSFLSGGNVISMNDTSSITPFWGLDINNNVIPTFNDTLHNPQTNRVIGTYPSAYLNARDISQYLGGSNTYKCSTLEMQAALGGRDMWEAFVANNRPDIKALLNLTPKYAPDNIIRPFIQNKNDLMPPVININASAAIGQDIENKKIEVFEFVKGYAQTFMGKKFLVSLPFLLVKQEPGSFELVYSQQPSDAGWTDGAPLGMDISNIDTFQDNDGRFTPVCRFDNIGTADLMRVNKDDCEFFQNSLFMRCQVDPRVLLTPTPAVVVTISSAVCDLPIDLLGGMATINNALQGDANALQNVNQNLTAGSVGLQVAPRHRYPDAVSIPLISNINTYGPWWVFGAPGKVQYEHDESLTPWNYGSTAAMNSAGIAKVTAAIVLQQLSEAGNIELTGVPSISLGEVMVLGGPQLTGINVSVDPQRGTTTQYRFENFGTRLGLFTQGLAERIRITGLGQQKTRKNLRELYAQVYDINNPGTSAPIPMIRWNDDLPPELKRLSPHEMVIGSTYVDTNDGRTRRSVSTCTMQEALYAVNAQDSGVYSHSAAMNWSGLLSPIDTNESADMSCFINPTDSISNANTIHSNNYDPFNIGDDSLIINQGNDIELFTTGNQWPGNFNQYLYPDDTNYARILGLRGPLVMSGWGTDIYGSAVPFLPVSTFSPQVSSEAWPAGPIDLLWDPQRGVWTSHDILIGTVQTQITAANGGNMGSGIVTVKDGFGLSFENITVYNWHNQSVSAGKNVQMGFNIRNLNWQVISADC